MKEIKLNLGCGDKLLEGYINVDLVEDRSGVKPDVNCDLRNLSVFESDYADEILSVHVVEHFWRWEVEQVLSEWVRVLKPGGKLILECPNLISACEEFLKAIQCDGYPDRHDYAQLNIEVIPRTETEQGDNGQEKVIHPDLF